MSVVVQVGNHLTPDELAKAAGIPLEEVYRVCREEHVPIYNGKICKQLFGTQLNALGIEHQLILN